MTDTQQHFTYDFEDVDDLQSAVFMALGAASVCWDDMAGKGVFDDQRAREIGESLIGWIERRYAPVITTEDGPVQPVHPLRTDLPTPEPKGSVFARLRARKGKRHARTP